MTHTGRSEKTKYRLAEALKECMKTTPFEDITVKQVVSVCGVTRQTFYRNFLDLNDLVQWYFNIILDESFRQMGSGETVYDGLVRKFEYIHEEHLFFSAAFSTDSSNNLREHDFRMILDFYRNLMAVLDGEAEIIVKLPQVQRVMRLMEAIMESAETGQVVGFEA
jgi:AcrR family transcriptional regulator